MRLKATASPLAAGTFTAATAVSPAPVRPSTIRPTAMRSGAIRPGAIRKISSQRRGAPAKPAASSATLHPHSAHVPSVVPLVLPETASAESSPSKIANGKALKNTAAAQAAKLALRDRVVLEHVPLVKAIAVRVHENLPVHVDLDDLVHAGILGLFDAASKYNPEKQVIFSSYAKHRIKGAILDSLRQLDWASRDMRRRHKQVEAATRDLAAQLQRTPTEDEVATKLGMDVDRWRTMMLDLRNVGLISASTRGNENDDLPAPDFPSKPETQPDSICAREQLRSVLGVAMKTLPERYQKVVSLYYTNEMTMKEIGGILGINESRVSQIHKAALEKMNAALTTSGITSSQAF
jgi:RNA polymerase sigma factor for flagellar operon FliA